MSFEGRPVFRTFLRLRTALRFRLSDLADLLGLLPGEGFPAIDRELAILWLKFQSVASSTETLGGDEL